MPKIKLEYNKPVECTLKYAQGKYYASTIPTLPGSLMYSLTSGDCIFLPESANEMFANAGIGANTPFRICRRKTPAKGEYYEVVALNTPAPGLPEPPTALESTLRASIDQVQQRALPSKVTPAAAPNVMEENVRSVNYTAPARNRMADALVEAIDAAITAEAYAKTKGLPVEFQAEDIRAIAATLYIQAVKDQSFGAQRDAAASRANGGATWNH